MLHSRTAASSLAHQIHPVYVKDVGFIALRSLQPGDIVLAANEEEISQYDARGLQTNQKSSSIEALSSGDTSPPVAGRTACITCRPANTASRELDVYTRKSGGTLTALSLLDTIFTIEMAIPSTTCWTTWSASPAKNTTPTTCHSCQTKSGRNGENGFTRSAGAPRIGINRRMEDSGIENLASNYGRTVSHSRIVASNADQLSHPEVLTESGFRHPQVAAFQGER